MFLRSSVTEIAAVLPTDRWTLVGGLMTQLLSIHRRLGIVRSTNDVDIVLHIKTSHGVACETPPRCAPSATTCDRQSIRAQCGGKTLHRDVTA